MARTLVSLLAALLALGAAAPARALTIISSDRTITSANSITDDVKVTSSAIVTIEAGGSITGLVTLADNSTINLAGGSIHGVVEVGDPTVSPEQPPTPMLNITSGSINGGV